MHPSASLPSRWILSALLLLLVDLHASAQAYSPAQAKNIKELHIVDRSNNPIDESFVRGFIQTKAGDPLDPATLYRDVRSLLDSRRFSYVDAKIDDVSDPANPKVYITIEARERLTADPTFVGLDSISSKQAKKFTKLAAGDFVDDQIAETARAALLAHYREKRYFDATVSYSLQDAKDLPGSKTLLFTVSEGKRYKVEFLEFDGATVISQEELGSFAGLHDWYNPLSWVTTPRVTDADLDIVAADAKRQYLEAGYLDATVSKAIKEKRGDNRLHVTFEVNEGPRYTIESFRLTGVTLFPEAELQKLIFLKKGDIANSKAIDAIASAISDYYTSRGYPDTRVTQTYSSTENNAIAVTFSIKEGSLVSIRNILITGNTITKDKVIRREIGLAPGDLYNTVAANRAVRRLKNLGYFSDVRNHSVFIDDKNRDMVFDVSEQQTGNLSFGVGFSSVDNVIGMFGISQSNFDIFNWPHFRGGGQKARADLQIASDYTDLTISFVEPWFLDRRLSLSTDIVIQNHGYDEYDLRNYGIDIGLQKMVPWVGRVGLSYGLMAYQLSDVIEDDFYLLADESKDYSFLDEDDSYVLGKLKLSWLYDTRDAALVPTRGTRASASATLYHGFLGSQYDMYELNARVNNYHRLPFGFLLALSANVSTIDSIGDDEVPIGSRYFLGGSRNIRGFRHRNVGPKAIYKNKELYGDDFAPIGGQTMLWATAELSLPLVSKIRAATFYDVGGVWADSFDFDLGNINTSYGFGLRFDFPMFPIRLDYAIPIDQEDDYMRKRNLVFWIGFDN